MEDKKRTVYRKMLSISLCPFSAILEVSGQILEFLTIFVTNYTDNLSKQAVLCCKQGETQNTVIKNGKFSTIILYDDKRVILCHCCIPLNFLDFKDLKKLKKTNEGHKGQIKGQNVSNTNSLYFLGIVGFIWKY